MAGLDSHLLEQVLPCPDFQDSQSLLSKCLLPWVVLNNTSQFNQGPLGEVSLATSLTRGNISGYTWFPCVATDQSVNEKILPKAETSENPATFSSLVSQFEP